MQLTIWDKIETRIAEPDLAALSREAVMEALNAPGGWAETELGRPISEDDIARVGHVRWA